MTYYGHMLSYFNQEKTPATWVKGGTGSYNALGEYVDGATTQEDILIISPQPITASDLTVADDGEHIQDYLKSWTESDVFTREELKDSDRLVWNGVNYKVVHVEQRKLGKYRRFFMKKVRP